MVQRSPVCSPSVNPTGYNLNNYGTISNTGNWPWHSVCVEFYAALLPV